MIVFADVCCQGNLYRGKREVKLYRGNSQKTKDANKTLVLRIQAEIRTILFKRYYKEPLLCIEIHINDAEKHYTTKEGWYYEVRHWRYGAYLGVDKCFAIGEGDTLKQYVEDTMDDNHADDVVLTNGNTIISIDLW
jgi:hypothetical protein